MIKGDNGALLISTASGIKQFIDGNVGAYPVHGAGLGFNPSQLLRDRNC